MKVVAVLCTLQMWSHLSTPFTGLPYRMSGGGGGVASLWTDFSDLKL